jgi:thiamine-phosphate pyrophosphorylase
MNPILRILDANANRSREAMRVLEEAARFALDDADLSGRLKSLRHGLAAALKRLPPVELHRDTEADVGTRLTAPAERTRGSIADVAVAAGKRLGEALRALEEYGKVIDPAFAAAVKRLRYAAYQAERRLHQRLGPAARQWRLCVIVTESLCRRPWLDTARAAIDAGADCVQLREKQLDDAERLRRAAKLVRLSDRRAAVIVNDRPDIALLAGADGVHLGEFDLPPSEVRRLAGRSMILGASTHRLAEARAALAAGVDYCGVGAIFRTPTKARQPSGLDYLRRFVRRFPQTPHLAIGGITADNAPRVVEAGARGLAVCAAVCDAVRPDRVVRRLLRAVPR